METQTENPLSRQFILKNTCPFTFFKYLRINKSEEEINLVSEIDTKKIHLIKPFNYYEVLTFKTFICEIVYNAINMFPDICEYVIVCKNENGISYLTLGFYEEIADDGHPCMAIYKCYQNEKDSSPIIYHLELKDIEQLYCNNRHDAVDASTINTLMCLLYMGGSSPSVSTFSKVNKTKLKQTLKFK